MSDLTSMVNIGREMSRKLQAVGISSPEQLRETGAVGAYLRLKSVYPHVCLVHLYALEGAVRGGGLQRAAGGGEEGAEGVQRPAPVIKDGSPSHHSGRRRCRGEAGPLL